MRILWHSNAPWSNTGYGAQTRLFTPRVRDLGHEVAISAYWGLSGAVFTWDGMTVFPGDDAWGNRLLSSLAEHYKADVVLTLMDVWVLNTARMKGLPLACWVPVDHEPTPPKVLEFFQQTGAKPIAMSRFGERMLTDAGLDPAYVPHGVDTSIFRPRPEARGRLRDRVGIPQDAFVVGMVAANKGNQPPRKAFPQVLQAFAQLRAEHSDAYLYLHCDPVGQNGVHIPKLAEDLGIPEEAILFTNPLQLELGVPDDDMAELYSSFDVLANPSYGEGFGIPIIEAQACGLPVIVTDCTAMSELCGEGWAIGGDRWFNAQQRSFWTCPRVTELVEAMRAAYDEPRAPNMEAVAFAAEYDAELVAEKYWRPTLARLGASEAARAPALV